MSISLNPIGISGTVLLFGIPAVGFVAVCRILVPYFHQNVGLHPALSWFIGGLLTFLPLFLLALFLARKDGFLTKAELSSRFRLKKCRTATGNLH